MPHLIRFDFYNNFDIGAISIKIHNGYINSGGWYFYSSNRSY